MPSPLRMLNQEREREKDEGIDNVSGLTLLVARG
jgi:hypothetical protein